MSGHDQDETYRGLWGTEETPSEDAGVPACSRVGFGDLQHVRLYTGPQT